MSDKFVIKLSFTTTLSLFNLKHIMWKSSCQNIGKEFKSLTTPNN